MNTLATGLRSAGRIQVAVRTAVVAHVPPLAILGIFALAYMLVLGENHLKATHIVAPLLMSVAPQTAVFVVCALPIGLIALMLSPKGKRSPRGALRWLATRDWADILCLRFPIAIAYTITITYYYVSFKINIGNLNAYSWDHFFATLDQLLFFNLDPWRLTHGLLPGRTATILLDMFYLIWFLVMQLSVFSVAALPARHPLRLQFLTAFGLSWLIAGVLLAVLFASAGPVYLERLTGDAMFAPLMQRLHEQSQTVEILALHGHEMLWDGYIGRNGTPPFGISAFPSMHLTIATLCACLGFAVSRVLGWMLAAYTLIILVGSVHLGWHYAVDGFAGIALAIGFWRSAGRLVSWWLARTAQKVERSAPAMAHTAE